MSFKPVLMIHMSVQYKLYTHEICEIRNKKYTVTSYMSLGQKQQYMSLKPVLSHVDIYKDYSHSCNI